MLHRFTCQCYGDFEWEAGKYLQALETIALGQMLGHGYQQARTHGSTPIPSPIQQVGVFGDWKARAVDKEVLTAPVAVED